MSRAEFDRLWNLYDSALDNRDPKLRYEVDAAQGLKILRQCCSQSDRDSLLNDPDPGVVCALISFYIQENERARLVEVLAKACPDYLWLGDPEAAIALSSRFPEAITILFEAYKKSSSKSARANIAAGLRRGFSFTGNLPQDDDALVDYCRRWYEANRANFEPNLEYFFNSQQFGRGKPYPRGLFKPKTPNP